MAKLKTEVNTSAMEGRIAKAFEVSDAGIELERRGDFFSTDFEHGQWWITCADGRVWSVVDAVGGGSIDGFDFELVT